MPETLLRTKLSVPPLRSNLVPRQRLIEKLNQGLQQGCKLTLISAPAGFGKTTLVSTWVQQIERPIAWLSLEESDSDLTRFLTYFIAALQTIESDFGKGLLATLQSSGTLNIEFVRTTLLNEITEFADDVVLILDDYHVIESQPIDEAISFLLEHLPSQMHLVIAGRIDPSLPLSRLRARGQMTEIRAHDLRFAADEATAFFNRVIGLNLSDQEIAALEIRTEGWIAGLQLAALSMKSFKRSSEIIDFIENFTGSDRFIQDYLMDEVLLRQSQGTKDFLLQTSILKRLSGSLCDAVTGQKEGQAILESLEVANLFIVPLDNERRWYRYHHLFADLLIHRLSRAFPDSSPELHKRASVWYENEGYIDDAVHHAQSAGDTELLAEVIEGHWQEIVHQGDLAKLKRLLDSLGPEYSKKSAPLSMAYCWIHNLTGENDAIPNHIKDIRQVLQEETKINDAPQPIKLAVIPSLVETMEAIIALDRKQPRKAKMHAQKSIALIPDDPNPATRGLLQGAASYRLAQAHRELGEYDQACALLLEGLAMLKASENYIGVAYTILQIVTMYQASGKTKAAISLCEENLAYIIENNWQKMPPSGLVNVILAGLQADSGDSEAAKKNLEIGQALLEPIKNEQTINLVNGVEEKLDQMTLSTQPFVEPLSPRELEVMQLIAQGLSNREIGERLFLALDTVKGHNRKIYGKLGVNNRTQAVNKAISLNILSPQ